MTHSLYWLSVDVVTGAILAELPDLTISGPLKKTIGRYETLSASLPVGTDRTPADWVRATVPGASNIIGFDSATDTPLWGGMVLQRTRSDSDTVTLALATIEAYFDRRYTGTVGYTSQSPNLVVADVVRRFVLNGAAGKAGLPIRVRYVAGSTLTSQAYYDYNDTTVYSTLTTLMGLLNGPEWTVEWEWQHAPERVTPVLIVGGSDGSHRIGASALPGLRPASLFSMPGCVTAAQLVEDYSTGKGATVVMATGSGQGLDRPTSGPYTVTDHLRPTFEYRFAPTQNKIIITSLAQHAQQALSVIGGGSAALTLTADIETAPRLGVDWSIGDDIGYEIGGLDSAGDDIAPAFPGGLQGVARCIGWEMTDEMTSTVSPILYVPTIYTGD